MQVTERRHEILAAVNARGVVSLREVAELVGTSEVTVRRDLRILAQQGLVRRTHGHVSPAPLSPREPTYQEKAQLAAEEKALIAAAAAAAVHDNAAIALGAGTTTMAMARLLTSRRDLTVVTNSLLVCNELLNAAGVQVVVTGGQLRTATHALVGPLAEQTLRGLYVTTLFVSGNGLTAARGLSTPDVLAAALDRRFAEMAAEIVVLADFTKVGVEAVNQTVPIGRIARVITDHRADPTEVARLQDAGVEVLVAVPGPDAHATQDAEPTTDRLAGGRAGRQEPA